MNKTEEKINKVFLDLLNKKDFKDITISEISKKCGITRTYFYQFYTDKNELATTTFLNINEKLFREFAKCFSDLKDHQNYYLGIVNGVNQIRVHATALSKLLEIIGPNIDLTSLFEKYLKENMKTNILQASKNITEEKNDYFLTVFSSATVTTIHWIVKNPNVSAHDEVEWLDDFTWAAIQKLFM